MAVDVHVRQGHDLVLGDEPPPELAEAFSRRTMQTYGDLVDEGLLAGEDLEHLVRAARVVTEHTIADPGTFRGRRPPIGARRHDLGRFPAMLAATPEVDRASLGVFWRFARESEPLVVSRWDVGDAVRLPLGKVGDIIKWVFGDVTVDSGATLTIKSTSPKLICNALLIRKNGRIVCTGKSTFISAGSIKGEE